MDLILYLPGNSYAHCYLKILIPCLLFLHE